MNDLSDLFSGLLCVLYPQGAVCRAGPPETPNQDIVRYLCRARACVNVRGVSGARPLHYAAWRGHQAILRCLLGERASPTHLFAHGDRGLEAIVAPSAPDILALALHLGPRYLAEFMTEGFRHLDGLCALHIAAHAGHACSVGMLCESSVNLLQRAQDAKHEYDGVTALHLAAYADHLEVVETLCKNAADANAFRNDGGTPAEGTAFHGHVRILMALMCAGANLHIAKSNGWTPLMSAAYKGHDGVISFLLDHFADANCAAEDARTALLCAVSAGHATTVGQLLIARADVQQSKSTGATPLHVAAWAGHLPIVSALYGRGARRDVTMRSGRTTPLDLAMTAGHVDVVDMLKKRLGLAKQPEQSNVREHACCCGTRKAWLLRSYLRDL